MKNKKLLIIIILIIIIILFFSILLIMSKNNTNKNNNEITSNSNVSSDIEDSNTYTFFNKLDEKNETTLIIDKQKSFAYKKEVIDGFESDYVIRNESTYLLDDNEKQYYKYANNSNLTSELSIIIDAFKEAKNTENTERIKGKIYNYVEVNTSDFLYNEEEFIENDEDYSNIKTRLYFSNNELKYIKTILNNKQELLEASLITEIDSTKFELPKDYKEVVVEEEENNAGNEMQEEDESEEEEQETENN